MTALVRRAALASVLAISLCGVMVAVCGKVPSLGFGAAAQSSGAPQVSFVVSGLMGLDGGWIAVSDINDAGRATGSASQQGQQRAVIWNDGRIVDLGIPGAGTSRGVAVDAAGRVACLATDPVGEFVCRGLLCDPDGESVDLELRTSMADSRCDVCGMNNLGQVVGAIRLADGTWEPAVWDRGGAAVSLGASPGRAKDINDMGQVAGYVGSGPMERACVWEPQADGSYAMTWVAPPSAGVSRAVAINDAGMVVGRAFARDDGRLRAFAYSSETGMRELPRPAGACIYWACDISDKGWIVGAAVGSGPRAVLWIGDQAMDLNDCIDPMSSWELVVARAVNNCGDIIGRGIFFDEEGGMFILRPERMTDSTVG